MDYSTRTRMCSHSNLVCRHYRQSVRVVCARVLASHMCISNDLSLYGPHQRMERATERYNTIIQSLTSMSHCNTGPNNCIGCKRLETEKDRMRDVATDTLEESTRRLNRYMRSDWRLYFS